MLRMIGWFENIWSTIGSYVFNGDESVGFCLETFSRNYDVYPNFDACAYFIIWPFNFEVVARRTKPHSYLAYSWSLMIGVKVMQFTQNKKHAKELELRHDTRSNRIESLHFQLELMPNYQDRDANFSRDRGGKYGRESKKWRG